MCEYNFILFIMTENSCCFAGMKDPSVLLYATILLLIVFLFSPIPVCPSGKTGQTEDSLAAAASFLASSYTVLRRQSKKKIKLASLQRLHQEIGRAVIPRPRLVLSRITKRRVMNRVIGVASPNSPPFLSFFGYESGLDPVQNSIKGFWRRK